MSDIAARNRRNKRKGAGWEIDLEQYYIGQGLAAERLVRRGKDDEGDLVIMAHDLAVVLEAKAEKTYRLTEYSREARAEAQRWKDRHTVTAPAFVLGAFDVKIPRLSVGEGIVGITNEDFARLLIYLQGR
jgi:FAD/FMN-containing dehydrogenase